MTANIAASTPAVFLSLTIRSIFLRRWRRPPRRLKVRRICEWPISASTAEGALARASTAEGVLKRGLTRNSIVAGALCLACLSPPRRKYQSPHLCCVRHAARDPASLIKLSYTAVSWEMSWRLGNRHGDLTPLAVRAGYFVGPPQLAASLMAGTQRPVQYLTLGILAFG